MGGQAWWSFGGLFLVDSPEQRRLGIKDSRELAWQDWLGTAGFDREEDEDYWGKNGLKLTSILLPEKKNVAAQNGRALFPGCRLG